MNMDRFFEKWYKYFATFASSKLSKYAGRYVAPTDPEALDYVHDAYVKATKLNRDMTSAMGRFEGTETNRKTWFCVLIDNCMKDKFKSAANRLELYAENPIYENTVQHSTISERNENVVEILKAIKPHLPDNFYKVLLLRTVSLSYSEIADVLSIPLGTATSSVSKVKTRLKHLNLSTDIL